MESLFLNSPLNDDIKMSYPHILFQNNIFSLITVININVRQLSE